jgi:hypothetical protein
LPQMRQRAPRNSEGSSALRDDEGGDDSKYDF